MNRDQLIQSIVARKLANVELNRVICFVQKTICFTSAERASRGRSN